MLARYPKLQWLERVNVSFCYDYFSWYGYTTNALSICPREDLETGKVPNSQRRKDGL